MSRVSRIENVIPGAGNVTSREIIQGEADLFQVSLTDSSDTAIDITSYTISARNEFYTASVEVDSRGNPTISQINDVLSTPAASDLTVTKDSDPTSGNFTITFPANYYSPDIAINISENVPLGVTYVTINDGGGNIDKFRIVSIIRRGL